MSPLLSRSFDLHGDRGRRLKVGRPTLALAPWYTMEPPCRQAPGQRPPTLRAAEERGGVNEEEGGRVGV